MTAAPRSRRWDDESLTEAIGRQSSWRAVARSLGLRGTSAGTIRALKRRAGELELDTSHFTGQRTWSDRQLRDAIAASSTWSDVIRVLGLSDRGDIRIRLKGKALRLGVDASHLAVPTAECSIDLRHLARQT